MKLQLSSRTSSLVEIILQELGVREHPIVRSLLMGDWRETIYAEHRFDSPELYLASEILSKFPFDLGIDRASVALEKFKDVEDSLASVAAQLRKQIVRGFKDPDVHWIYHLARVKIDRLLPCFSWDACEEYFSFGPGAAVGIKRRVSQRPNKFGFFKPTVSQNCLDLAVAAIRSNRVWCDYHTSISGQDPAQWFTIVPGNKVTTVPKNSKTDRVIAIEPCLNMFLQKGLGGVIRSYLKRVGVDLNDQSLNQTAAKEASVSGKLATVDLSSASDSVSWVLVQDLLPADWVSAIEMCRSTQGVLPDGTSVLYQKVSSMGNGFTFELESLIFWAFCSAVCEFHGLSDRSNRIYGDDLIVPTETVPTLQKVFNEIGFTLNSKKTHADGYFRESCGKHYFHGSDVSPFYIRENVDRPEVQVQIANRIRHYAFHRVGAGWGCDSRLELPWVALVSAIPKSCQTAGPLHIGTDVNTTALGLNFDEARPSLHRAEGDLEGYVASQLVRRRNRKRVSPIGTLIQYLDENGRSIPMDRGKLSVYHTESGKYMPEACIVQRWEDCGPWVTTV